MKTPWQVWTLYACCLFLVVATMVWLTVKAEELDRAGVAYQRSLNLARRQAELQELLGTALWRLDWTLTPLVAQEAARPYFVYESFYQLQVEPLAQVKGQTRRGQGGKPSGKVREQVSRMEAIPSPLLIQPSEYVLLHFQVAPDDSWISPQNPTGVDCLPALANGTTQDNIRLSAGRLGQLQQSVQHRDLLGMLPERLLPLEETDGSLPDNGGYGLNYDQGALNQESGQAAPYNDLGLSQIPQQLERLGASNAGQAAANPQTDANANGPAQQPMQTPIQNQMLRGGIEWQLCNNAYQSFANSIARQQRAGNTVTPAVSLVREGVSRPVWIDGKLLVARRVIRHDQTVIQGCWLNWDRLRSVLLDEIADLLPGAELQAVTPDADVDASRTLATLPVQIVPLTQPSMAAESSRSFSAIRVSLMIAWASLFTVALAVGVVLRGVLTLSERRGAFVAAVTHELRTPLTTFRMYAEMLAQGMVPTEEKRRLYLETLRSEADRLSHLVENVLQYARLERGRPVQMHEVLSVSTFLDRTSERLTERAAQAGMQLCLEIDKSAVDATVRTDPVACEQVLFNLVDNACKYGGNLADQRIHLRAGTNGRWLELRVEDHGPGIGRLDPKRLFRPFSKSVDEAANSAPGVGLGLALCRRLAGHLGGRLSLESTTQGASFLLRLPLPT